MPNFLSEITRGFAPEYLAGYGKTKKQVLYEYAFNMLPALEYKAC